MSEETNIAKIEPGSIVHTPAPSSQETLMQMISAAAADPNANVEKMERLMGMYERITAKQAETEYNAALNKAQSEIGRVAADRENKQTHSVYASYAAIDRAIRPVYSSNGFSLSFDTEKTEKENYVTVVCYVSHSAGHTRKYSTEMPADGKGAKGNDVMTKTHAFGSATQYGMRYLIKMIFNIAIGEDDDGNAAGQLTRMSLERFNEWEKELNAQTTVESLGEVYSRAVAECKAFNDVATRDLLKNIASSQKKLILSAQDGEAEE